eukprot:scaffold41354_cov53-Attheya_sp.AAC.3
MAETKNSNNTGNGPPLVPPTDVVERLLTASRENEAFIIEEIEADPSYACCYNRYKAWIDKERQTEGLAITAKYIEMNNLDLYFLKVIQHLTVTPGVLGNKAGGYQSGHPMPIIPRSRSHDSIKVTRMSQWNRMPRTHLAPIGTEVSSRNHTELEMVIVNNTITVAEAKPPLIIMHNVT